MTATASKVRVPSHEDCSVALRSITSVRNGQRTLALLIGRMNSNRVPKVALRDLCAEFKIYDTPTFAHNMRRTAGTRTQRYDDPHFSEIGTGHERAGWRLTPAGRAEADRINAIIGKAKR